MARDVELGRRAGNAGARGRSRHAARRPRRRVRPARPSGYRLSEAQAQAILDMRLHRLTGLEQDKIVAEYQELLAQIRDLSDILARPERLLAGDSRRARRDPRRSTATSAAPKSSQDHSDLTIEDLIEPQDVVVTLSHGGYAKAQPVTEYQAQRRGGRGKAATAVKDEDFVDKLFVAQHARHAAVLLQPRQALLAQGLSAAAGGPRLARQADGEPAAAAGGRAHHCGAADPASSKRTSSCSWPRRRARSRRRRSSAFSRPRAGRHHRHRAGAERPAGRRRTSPTAPRRSSCARAAARRSASTKTKCGRWVARPPACAASGCRSAQEVISLIIVDEQGMVLTARRTATASSRRSRISRSTAAAARASSRCRPPSATARWSARCR